MSLLGCVLLAAMAQLELAAAKTAPHAPSPLTRVFGHTPVTSMSGNGRLTVSFDESGRVVSMRWPSPGYYEHGVIPTSAHDPLRTLEWVLGDGTALHRPTDGEGTQRYRSPDSVVVMNTWEAGPYQVTQHAFVHPALDVLLIHLHIEGDTPPAELRAVWRPSPTSRLIPETPMVASNAGSTLSFYNERRVYAFKPHDHSAATREKLARAATGTMAGEALEEPAIWLGLETHPAPSSVTIAPRGDEAAGGATGHDALKGPAEATITLRPEPAGGAWEAWVLVSAAETRDAVDEALLMAANRRDILLEGVDRFWRARLDRLNLPASPGTPEFGLARRALLTILMLQDRSTGAIIRGPVSSPPLALDRPQDSVWASQALAAAGLKGEAQRHIRFLAAAMRDGRRRMHDGSFAAAYHADGAEAVPPMVLDTGQSAWFVWACREMASLLPDDEAFGESVWRPVRRATDFVYGWWDPVRRHPLASFDPGLLRDRARPEQLLTAYAALDNALEIAGLLGERRDDWVSRRAELRALIDYHLVDETGDWRLDDPIPYWPMGAFPLENPVWDRVIEAHAVLPLGLPPHEAARALHFRVRAALARGEEPPGELAAELARIAELSKFSDASAHEAFWPDSLTAAHVFLALHFAQPPP